MKKLYIWILSIVLLITLAGVLLVVWLRYNPLTLQVYNFDGTLISDDTTFIKNKFEGNWVDLAELDLMNGNHLIFTGGYSFNIRNEKFISIKQFKGLMKLNEKNVLKLPNNSDIDLNFESDSFILLDTDSQTIWLLDGFAKINDIDIQAGDRIVYSELILVEKIDRQEITQIFREFIERGAKLKLLPIQATDFDSPKLLNENIPGETLDEKISVKIKCEDCVVLFANDQNLSEFILDGQAEVDYEYNLVPGENTLNILAIDENRNKTVQTHKVLRKDPCEGNTKCGECDNPACPTPIPTSTPKPKQPTITTKPNPTSIPTSSPTPTQLPVGSCTSGSFNNSFLSLLNTYRQSQGLNTLSIESKLTNAAYSHSYWMANGGGMSHTGANGSSPWDRCKTAGTTCDAENIAYGSSDSSVVFDMWKNSAGHNANMLGSHSVIGICVVGGYSTLVLR
jgi:uncharacterized protein YkwD